MLRHGKPIHRFAGPPHHFLDRLDLRSSQLLRQGSWTRKHVIELAGFFAFPRMVPRLRQTESAQHDSQGKDGTRSLYRTKEHHLPGAVGQSGMIESKSRHPHQNDKELEDGGESVVALAKLDDFLLQRERIHVDDVDRDNVAAG